jgi:hypothetical protein
MKRSEIHSEERKQPLWIRIRFYVLIILATVLLLAILIILNKGSHLKENIYPALISLANAISAYSIAKQHDTNGKEYKRIMKKVYWWTLFRFIAMTAFILVLILGKWVEPVSFIFSFIGFYIIHQVIEIRILQRENQ